VTALFRRRRNIKPALALVVFFAFLAGFLYLIDRTLRSTFFSIAEVKAVQAATEAAQRAIQREVSDGNLQYQDFIYIHKDAQGHVVLMQANTVKINGVAADTALVIQKALEGLRWQSFSIPLGQALGIPMFANYGPRITYHVVPVGSVRVNIMDKFETAGINQTKHAIYLNFDTNVRIVIPSKTGEASVASQMPLAESIIVGSVPSTFVSVPGSIFGSGLVK